jgi:hypothetical protein
VIRLYFLLDALHVSDYISPSSGATFISCTLHLIYANTSGCCVAIGCPWIMHGAYNIKKLKYTPRCLEFFLHLYGYRRLSCLVTCYVCFITPTVLILLVTVLEYMLCRIFMFKIMTFGYHQNVFCVFRTFGRLWNFVNVCRAFSGQAYVRKVLCIPTSCVNAGNHCFSFII